MSVKWTDMGLEKVLADVRRLKRVELVTGVVGEKAEEPHGDSGLTIGEIALIQEMGTKDGHIPARPFVGLTAKEQRNNLIKWMREASQSVIAGKKSPNDALDGVGKKFEDEIRNTITRQEMEPNAPSTAAKKGFDFPLLDSGQMIAAIGHYQRIKGVIDDEGNFVTNEVNSGEGE